MCAPQLPCKDRGWVLQLARCDETIWDPNKYIKLAGGGENCFGFVWRHPWSHSVKQNKIREKKKFCFQLFSCDIVCFKMKCFGFRWLKLQAQFQRKTSWFKKEYFSKTFLLFWSTAPSLCLSLECVCSCQSCGIWSYRLSCLPLHFLHHSTCTGLTPHQSGRQHWKQSMGSQSFLQCLHTPWVPFEATFKWNKGKG